MKTCHSKLRAEVGWCISGISQENESDTWQWSCRQRASEEQRAQEGKHSPTCPRPGLYKLRISIPRDTFRTWGYVEREILSNMQDL